jgi:hypothetical protein
MPLRLLLVEGNLDSEVLTAVFRGQPAVRRGGSKNGLKPQAKQERQQNHVDAGYLRDRDFDYEPPTDTSAAVIDSLDGDEPLGWRWARHELENYLIDPAIVEPATGIPRGEWSHHLVEAALRIRWFQIARWTVGEIRRSVPPAYRLETRPPQLAEFELPDCLGKEEARNWCASSIRTFASHVAENMSAGNVAESSELRAALLTESFLSDAANVLVWCSGKDLLAAIDPDIRERVGCETAGSFRARLRDWIRNNADAAVAVFPEWRDLISQVRAK